MGNGKRLIRNPKNGVAGDIDNMQIPVMAAIAVRKKVISMGHFSPCFRLQLMQIILFVRLNQVQLSILNALKIREK